MSKPKTKKSLIRIGDMIPQDDDCVFVNGFMLGRMADGTSWLQHPDGEGMQLMGKGEQELEKVLSYFFRENF